MSILDDLISAARRKQQDEQRKKLEKEAKQVRRAIGKELYTLLDVQHNEYRGLLEFTVRGVTFYLSSPTGWGVYVTRKVDYDRAFSDTIHALTGDDVLLFVDKYTRSPQSSDRA